MNWRVIWKVEENALYIFSDGLGNQSFSSKKVARIQRYISRHEFIPLVRAGRERCGNYLIKGVKA